MLQLKYRGERSSLTIELKTDLNESQSVWLPLNLVSCSLGRDDAVVETDIEVGRSGALVPGLMVACNSPIRVESRWVSPVLVRTYVISSAALPTIDVITLSCLRYK